MGLTLGQLHGRDANRLFVAGLDFFDGTPIFDIKGYRPLYRTENYTLPDWFRKFADKSGNV
jgi:tRNA (Thr-GGU) A37 N-methylase